MAHKKVDGDEPQSIVELEPKPEPILEHTHDLASLEFVDEPNILNALMSRYENEIIYTSIGDIVVAVNPCRDVPLYTQEIMKSYQVADSLD